MLKKNALMVVMVAVVGTSLLAGLGGAPKPAAAASNMVPNYEVKLLLNPSAVLGSDFKLTSSVKSAFGMPDSVTKMNVQFLDTPRTFITMDGVQGFVRQREKTTLSLPTKSAMQLLATI
jgi:hypothetical protein